MDGETFWDIASAIRVEETRARKEDIRHYTPGDLVQDGISKMAPNWFVFSVGGMILNGSETNPDQEPTKLSLSNIVEIIEKVVNGYMPLCMRGKHPCNDKCSQYNWMLSCCERHREMTKRKRK